MKKIYSKLFLFFTLAFSGCASEGDCFIADQPKLVKKISYNAQNFYFYTITTGFQDKVTSLVLYDEEISFNDCGEGDKESLWSLALMDGNHKPKSVIIDNDKFYIEFEESGVNDNANFSNTEFVFGEIEIL